jgi:uncharacterized membrane protein
MVEPSVPVDSYPLKKWVPRALLLTVAILIAVLWVQLTPGGILGKADAVGYAVCHRIELHSFHLGMRILPLCSRCTGMYLGAFITLLAFTVLRRKAGSYPSVPIQIALFIFAGFWALDGINSFLSVLPGVPHIYPPNNLLRLITGTLIGVSLATMIYPIFIQTTWREWHTYAVIPSWPWLSSLLGILALVIWAVQSENPMMLYPLALLSSIGVLTLLTMAYSVLTLTLFRRQNQARTWSDLWLPLLGGLTLALSQVAIIDLFRFALTGTWDGFHL